MLSRRGFAFQSVALDEVASADLPAVEQHFVEAVHIGDFVPLFIEMYLQAYGYGFRTAFRIYVNYVSKPYGKLFGTVCSGRRRFGQEECRHTVANTRRRIDSTAFGQLSEAFHPADYLGGKQLPRRTGVTSHESQCPIRFSNTDTIGLQSLHAPMNSLIIETDAGSMQKGSLQKCFPRIFRRNIVRIILHLSCQTGISPVDTVAHRKSEPSI